MLNCKWILRTLSSVLLLSTLVFLSTPARAFETGGDLSELTWETNSQGITFESTTGAAVDPVAYAKSEHWTCVRLRLLVDGGAGVLGQTLNYDLALASRIKASGLHLDLDLFYSNGWCDPSQNYAPSEWSGYSYSQLKSTVQSYTASVITSFKNAGCLPDYVQIGNEINGGFLWPQGKWGSSSTQFVGLLQAGIAGVRQVSSTPRIILHIANATNTSAVEYFYNNIASQ